MKSQRFLAVVLSFLFVSAAFAACGGGGGGASTPKEVSRFAGAPPSGDNTEGDFVCGASRLQCRFSYPHGITSDNGALYVADTNHAIRKIDMATGAGSTIAGSAPVANPYRNDPAGFQYPRYFYRKNLGVAGYADGTGTASRFHEPRAVWADGANVYVSDSGNHAIRRIVLSTGEVTTLAGAAPADNPDYDNNNPMSAPRIGESGYADGTGSDARFFEPEGICGDGAGNLYVADKRNHAIRKVVIATGETTTLAGGHIEDPDNPGTYISQPDYVDGTGTAARFSRPTGIWYDNGALYVGDRDNHAIRKVVVATGETTTVAGAAPEADDPGNPATTWHGTSGTADGTGTAARFDFPTGVGVHAGYLYVTDSGSHTVRRIALDNAAVTTFAGAAGAQGATDGTRTDARFRSPQNVAFFDGDLFVIEADNHMVRKVLLP